MLLQRSNEIDIVKTDQEGAPLRRSTMECPDRERQDLVRPALKRLVPKRPVLEGFILERSALERMALDRSLDHRIRYRAVRALGQLKDPLSEEVLIRALDDDYPIVRHMAVSALAGMGTDSAASKLEEMLGSKSNCLKSMAARALIEIAGVPDSRLENLELLFKLLSSGDERVEKAILQIGDEAIPFLLSRLDLGSTIVRQHAALVLALRIRRAIDHLPPGWDPFPWLASHDIAPQSISDLYRFDIIREGALAYQVVNTGFDGISSALCQGSEIHFARRRSAEIDREIEYHGYNLTEFFDKAGIIDINLNDIIRQYKAGQPHRMGRTLIAPINRGFLALKMCVNPGDESRLLHEICMQEYLKKLPGLQGLSVESTLPCPLKGIYRIREIPRHLREGIYAAEPHAIGYIAGREYFAYVNEPQHSIQVMRRSLLVCARDLARLTGMGLIHASLMPLYHRRGDGSEEDDGYCWQRKVAGRLEKWLESCLYPNLRLSGLADYEHLEVHQDIQPQRLQSHIGRHLFSLSLLLASYLKNSGQLEENTLKSILEECFIQYYSTLARDPPGLDEAVDWDLMAGQMVEEMGSNKYSDGDSDSQHLGRPRGPFPIPALIRAIHIISAFLVIQMQAGSHSLICHRGIDRSPPPSRSRSTSGSTPSTLADRGSGPQTPQTSPAAPWSPGPHGARSGRHPALLPLGQRR